jgi:hypothetical protein
MSASPTQPKEAAAKAAEQLKVDVGKSLATLERLLKIGSYEAGRWARISTGSHK